jgi:hypothetical protein
MEVATHFIKAGDLASPQKVVRLARAAADQAFSECAWREAAEFYEAAASALARCGADQPDVAGHLAFRAALCHVWNLDNERALRLFDRAISSFEEAGNDRELVRVRLERLRAELDTVMPFAPIDAGLLEAALARLDADDQLRAQARADLGMAYVISGRIDEARESATAALALGDFAPPRARARAHVALSVVAWAELRLDDALAHLDATIAAAGSVGDVDGHLAASTRRALTLLWLGRVAQADHDAEVTLAYGDRHNLISGLVYPLAARVGVACLAGRADDAAVHADELALRCRLGDWTWSLAFSMPQMAALRALTAGRAEGLAVLDEWRRMRAAEIGGYPYGDYTDIFDVAVQMLADPEARRPDAELPKWLEATPLSGAIGWSGISAAAAEVAWWTGNDDLARKARRALQWCDAAGMRVVDGWLASAPRALGIALAGSGSLDAGLATVRRAREWAAGEDATLEVALCGWWECEIAKAAGVDAGEEAQAAAANVPSPGHQRGNQPWS